MSRRFTERPLAYSTLDDLQRGLLHQVRRFRRALCETAARGPILLNPDTPDKPPRKLPKPGDDRMANLELFHDQIVLLKNMSAQIVVNFSDIPKARNVKKTVDDLIADIEAKADVLRRQMADEAKGTVENTVITRNRALIRELQTDLGKSVSEIRETYLVGKITPPHIDAQVDADVAYAVLDDLLGPDGYRHPKYFVVTAYPIQKGVAGHNIAPMYVTVTPEFRTPNRLQWAAAPKTPQELRVLAKDLLIRDGVIGKAFPRDVPVPKNKIKFAHDNIKKTVVKGDQIEVHVKDAKRIDETMVELRSQLAGIVHQVDPKNRDLIRTRIERNTGVIRFVFSLPAKLRGRLVNNNVLMEIRKLLNLSDVEMQRVRTAIENPE